MTATSIGLEKKSRRSTGSAMAQTPSPAGIAIIEARRSEEQILRSRESRLWVVQAAVTAGNRLTPIVVVREGTRL